jgi:hypothetical protein
MGSVILLFMAHQLTFAQDSLVVIDDPLTNQSTLGETLGGTFTAEGWKTTGFNDRIAYQVGEPITSGRATFEAKGWDRSTDPWDPNQTHFWHSVFGMWDNSFEKYGLKAKFNPYKCQLWVASHVDGERWKSGHVVLRLNVHAVTTGSDDDPNAWEIMSEHEYQWDKDEWNTNELVWGNGRMTWTINGIKAVDIDYSSSGHEYVPNDHVIWLGRASDHYRHFSWLQTPINCTYRNLKVVRYVDQSAPEVIAHSPNNGETEVPLNQEVVIEFSEPMDQSLIPSALNITPAINGTMTWSGNSLYYVPSGPLNANTTYTVSLDTSARDMNGNALASPLEFSFTTTSTTIASQVERYGIFEIDLYSSTASGNRYKDVWVKGVFQGPTKTIEIAGFWNGEDQWIVRMAPTEIGTWTYTITSSNSQLTASGSFECIPSDHKGFLRVNPDYPYTFMYEDGTPWMWKGETSWRAVTNSISFESRFKPYIDLRASQGYNAVQWINFSYINGDAFWQNEGGPAFELHNTGKNYNKLNPDYYKWVDKRVEYALSKGMVPVMLFTWAQEYLKLTQDQFDHYIRYMVSRYAAYNIIWIICGEYNEIYAESNLTWDVWKRHGRTVKEADPYDHLTSLHPTGRTSSSEFKYDSWMDFIMQQSPYYYDHIQRDRKYNMPVVNGEYAYAGYHPDENVRYGAWQIITAGGFFTAGFFSTFAPDKGGWDMSANMQQQLELQFLFDFMENTRWWEMNPHDELVSTGHCLALPGEEYIIYSREGGSVDLDLSHVTGSIPMEWLNPRELTYSERTDLQGGSTVTLTPPFSGDWVLHVGNGVAQDTIPPNAPGNLTQTNQTMNTISMTWDEPLPAEDGDTASEYRIYRDGQAIGKVAQNQFTDYGLQADKSYTYEVFAIDDRRNESLTGVSATFNTIADTEAPVITGLQTLSRTDLQITFSEPVEQTSATTQSNYQISPSISISAIELQNDLRTVNLITGSHTEDVIYTLTVNNIKDRATSPNTIAANTQKTYKFESVLKISQINRTGYQVDTLKVGEKMYLDREFVFTNVPPDILDALMIRTANDDKLSTAFPFLTFQINRQSEVFIGYQSNLPIPSWMQEQGWTDTGLMIQSDDDSGQKVYVKEFQTGTVELGGNFGATSSSMYTVFVKPVDAGDVDAPLAPTGLVIRPL